MLINEDWDYSRDDVMHREDSSPERRSAKLSILLRSFEDYVNEVVANNHGMKQEEMPKIVIDNFRRSIQANVDFHTELAHVNEKDDDVANSSYHKVMAEIYRFLIK
jgi:hypothetical protein